MGQMTTADVTYTRIEGNDLASPSVPMREYEFLLTFGASTTSNSGYPVGGVPLVNGALGCPAYLRKLIAMDDGSSSGLVAKWDQKANAIRLYEIVLNSTFSGSPTTASFTSLLTELASAASVSLVTLRVLVQGW